MSTVIAESPNAISVPEERTVLLPVSDVIVDRMLSDAKGLTIKGIEDEEGYKLVDSKRWEFVKARTGIEKSVKSMNAPHRKIIEENNAEAKRLTARLAPEENRLQRLVDTVDAEKSRIEQERKDALYKSRLERITAAGGSLPESALRVMPDDEFEAELRKAETATKLRKAAEERARLEEEDRKQKAATEAARQRQEAEKLKAEQAEFAKQKAAQEAELAKQRAELDAVRIQLAAEQEERDRVAREEQEKVERAERERVEAEQRAVAEKERLAREAEEEAARMAREAALRPDRAKIADIADQLEQIVVPTLSEAAGSARYRVAQELEAAALRIRVIAERL